MNVIVTVAGVISGALLYIKEDFEAVDRKTWLQVCFRPFTTCFAVRFCADFVWFV